MAIDIQKLENHSGSGRGVKLFSYNGDTDTKAAIKGAGYFNTAATLLNVGDRISIKASDESFDAVVTSNADGIVAIGAVGSFA